jgi:hypothetical protein
MVGRFARQLHEQRRFLEASAASYDDGNEPEAKRLAVNIRVLVHDHGRSVSLLTHLGVKDQLGYVDTAIGVPPPGALILHAGLCMCSVTLGAPGAAHELRYKPVLSNLSPDREHPPTSFVDWWETPLVTDQEGNRYTRGSIVLSVANQDGGAHVDAQLNAAYELLVARNSLGLGASDDIEYKNSVALGTVRQVAHELLLSLDGLSEDPAAPQGVRVREPLCKLSIRSPPNLSRNDPCPCGSGRKAKHCFMQRRSRRHLTAPGA